MFWHIPFAINTEKCRRKERTLDAGCRQTRRVQQFTLLIFQRTTNGRSVCGSQIIIFGFANAIPSGIRAFARLNYVLTIANKWDLKLSVIALSL